MKKYKESFPLDTIYRVKNILNDIGILTKDTHFGQYPCYSCRISIGNSELSALNIGTNGKGRSFEYSMASGYAEFLERLQNHILLPKKKYATRKFLNDLSPDSMYVKNLYEKQLVLEYVYDINEENWDISTILLQLKEDLQQLFCMYTEKELFQFFTNDLDLKTSIMVPFFSVQNNKEILLPLDIFTAATASNGMCAGNTPEEALVQGFCEIFERYVAKQLYYNEITPPDITMSYFEGTPAYEELLHLRKNLNYHIIIKDCSLQKGYPVIGVLFIDQANQRYNFKLGADFIPYIALERCLTEILQGSKDIPTLPIHFFDLNSDKSQSVFDNFFDYNFQKIIIDHSGYWPISLFSCYSSYDFKGFSNLFGKSEKEDLNRCVQLIREQGYNIYIRDNSILGFPSYYIVIPGFSQLINDKALYDLYKKTFSKISVKDLHSIDKSQARILANAIDDNYYLIKYFRFNYAKLYLYNISEDLFDLDIELLVFMLFYYIEDFDQSKKYIDLFLENKERSFYNYYYAISDFIALRYRKNLTIEETESILQKCYGVDIIKDVITDIINPNSIFENYQFPNCFICENCPVSSTCSFESMLKIQRRINELAEKSKIKQINLSEIIKSYI